MILGVIVDRNSIAGSDHCVRSTNPKADTAEPELYADLDCGEFYCLCSGR